MNLRKLTASLLIVGQLTIAGSALADPVITLPEISLPAGEPDVGAALSPMKKGQVAPFTGVLLSPMASAIMITQINSLDAQIKIEVDRARAEEQAKSDFKVKEVTITLNADKSILQAHLDERTKEINILTDALKKEESNRSNTPLWMGVGTGVGLIVGVGITVLTVFAVGQASK